MTENSDYLNSNTVSKLEDAINIYMNEKISSYLYKVAKDYNSDIDGLGKFAVKNFLTMKDWENYNWLDNFNTSFFNVDVKTTVKSGYILVES